MPTQRDYIIKLNNKFRNKDKTVKAYAEGEKNGEVERKSNVNNLSPETYAEQLYNDGIKKGWL